jgi:NADPH:quinone reductase-like Zn-dependent oxidoreductase
VRRLLKVLAVTVIILAIPLAALGIALSHNSPCGAAPGLAGGSQPMKAAVHRCYGPPGVLKVEDIEKPSTGNDSVLVRVHAASLNAHDWHVIRGTPYLIRLLTGFGGPRDVRAVATDFAGTVEAVGQDVHRFKVGDEVFGYADDTHALAQYLTMRESGAIVKKPAGVSFEQAATIPVAGVTALQALRDLAHVRAGEKVLINGASGGVGTFAVQLAKSFGAEVTAVCSTRNLEMVRSLGADHLIDYTKEDFTQGTARYEVILDVAGNRSITEYRRVLAPQGILALVGAAPGNWLGPMAAPLEATVRGPFTQQKFLSVFAHVNADDLTRLAERMQSGQLKSVIDRNYTLDEAPRAMAYLEAGHARGKVVIDVE